MNQAFYICDEFKKHSPHIMKKANLKTANTVVNAFTAAGYIAAIADNMVGYTYKTRSYWFDISSDGSLLFNHCYSIATEAVSKDYRTAVAAYNRIEAVSGVAVCETI